MKTLSVGEIKEKLRPWAYRKLDQQNFDKIKDDELIDAINLVAQDLNERAEIRKERYNKNAVLGETNYEMQGDILKVYYFYYKDDDWKKQRWTWVGDVIVLKNPPSSNDVEMDIRYLRQVEPVTNTDTDEIDLPAEVLLDFLDLLKTKLLVDFGDAENEIYQARLEFVVRKILMKLPERGLVDKTTFSYYLGINDGSKYDITDFWVSQDSVTVDTSGNIIFI